MKEERASLVSTILTIGYGLISIGLAYLIQFMPGGVLQASFTIFGVVGGPLFGLFTLGMWVPFANSKVSSYSLFGVHILGTYLV